MAQQQQQQAHAANLQAEEAETAGTCQPISLLEVKAATVAVADPTLQKIFTNVCLIV